MTKLCRALYNMLPLICSILTALFPPLPLSFLPFPCRHKRFRFASPRIMLRQVTEGLVWGLFLLASNLAHATYVQEGTRLYEPGAYEFGETISTNGDGSMLAMCDNAENVYLYSVTQAGARTLVRVP